MNRSFFLYLWVCKRLISLVLIGLNIVAIICAIIYYQNTLALLVLTLVPLITIGFGAGSTKTIWNMRYEFLCRMAIDVVHHVPAYEKVTDGDMQGAQYFIRMYPWLSRSVDYKLVRVQDHEAKLFLKFHGGSGVPWELDAANGTKPLTKEQLSNLIKMVR